MNFFELAFWMIVIGMAACSIIFPIYVRASAAFEEMIERMVDDAFAAYAVDQR